MKALFYPNSMVKKGILIAALVSLTHFIYPEFSQVALANSSSTDQSAINFEIKDSKINILNYNPQSQSVLTFNQIVEQDPLAGDLKEYLESYNSPLAQYAPQIIQRDRWQMALAVSWVESNFGRFCYTNNCSGIGVSPDHPLWRRYKTKLDWFNDLTDLLAKPIYSEKYNTCKKMRGFYVYPGSDNWQNGCEQKLAELNKLTRDAEIKRIAKHNQAVLELAMVTKNP